MSIIADRLREVLPGIEIQLAWSVPVIDNGRETIFFYATEENDRGQYVIPEIRYVVYRDIYTGKLEKHNAADVIPEDLMSRVAEGVYSYPSDRKKEVEKKREYLKLYEELVSDATLNNPLDNDKIKRLIDLFGQLKQTEPLKEIYLVLAKDFFKE